MAWRRILARRLRSTGSEGGVKSDMGDSPFPLSRKALDAPAVTISSKVQFRLARSPYGGRVRPLAVRHPALGVVRRRRGLLLRIDALSPFPLCVGAAGVFDRPAVFPKRRTASDRAPGRQGCNTDVEVVRAFLFGKLVAIGKIFGEDLESVGHPGQSRFGADIPTTPKTLACRNSQIRRQKNNSPTLGEFTANYLDRSRLIFVAARALCSLRHGSSALRGYAHAGSASPNRSRSAARLRLQFVRA